MLLPLTGLLLGTDKRLTLNRLDISQIVQLWLEVSRTEDINIVLRQADDQTVAGWNPFRTFDHFDSRNHL
ncbi:hypothetical protein ACEYW6_22265 [Nostoc sp. UIC 10607]|uniref:hypothetical protein n=1 Tax=Nostoc sp. UIC 10607 TaxID=3045935 RepID=UPI0039A2972C